MGAHVLSLRRRRCVCRSPCCGQTQCAVLEVVPGTISRDILGREQVNDLYQYVLRWSGLPRFFIQP